MCCGGLQVWRVLTDYERLPSFVPNLESCRRLPCPKPGRVGALLNLPGRVCWQGRAARRGGAGGLSRKWLLHGNAVLTSWGRALPPACPAPSLSHNRRPAGRPPIICVQVWVSQRACSQSLLWRLEAEAVLEIEELVEEAAAGGEAGLGRREARFSLVQGDFKVRLHPQALCLVAASFQTRLAFAGAGREGTWGLVAAGMGGSGSCLQGLLGLEAGVGEAWVALAHACRRCG